MPGELELYASARRVLLDALDRRSRVGKDAAPIWDLTGPRLPGRLAASKVPWWIERSTPSPRSNRVTRVS